MDEAARSRALELFLACFEAMRGIKQMGFHARRSVKDREIPPAFFFCRLFWVAGLA